MARLDGKRIVVTGASRGLGRAFAVAVAGEGARVVINGTNAEKLAETAALVEAAGGAPAEQVVGSVADDDLCAAIVERCVTAFGGIDVLVNNAGVVRDRTLLKMTPEEFDEVIAVNLRGTWSCLRHAARAMSTQDPAGGHIINVTSNAGLTGGFGQGNYAASKAGVMGLTRTAVLELTRLGIRVNALWPIAVTDMTQVVLDRSAAAASAKGEDAPSAMSIGFGDASDVARVVTYLASDRAAHLNGQVVTFNNHKLALWTHPREVEITLRDGWSVDDIADALAAAEQQPLYSAF